VQVRLAAAGCLHTAVALELAAGQARAAELDSDARRPRGPVSATAERAAGANPASNLKSRSGAFGTRRPTRTTTRSNPRWIGRLLRAGLEPQSPGYRRPAAGRTKAPTYAPAPPRPRPAHAADSAGGLRRAHGETPARAMARHTTPDIAARHGPSGAETDLDRHGWTQSLAGPHRPQSARHIGPTRHSTWRTCRLLRVTDSDGTCRPPASTHDGLARPDKAVTPDKNVPGDDPSRDPAQHPSAKTLARPGHRPGPTKYFTAAAAGSPRLQRHHNPRAEATATRMPLRKKTILLK
jgi:hypothetical protein